MEDAYKHNAAGELELTVDGTTYLLRPTIRCAMNIEKKLGKHLRLVLEAFKADAVSLTEAYDIVNFAVIAGGREAGLPDTIESLGGMKLMLLAVTVTSLLATGGKKQEVQAEGGPQ